MVRSGATATTARGPSPRAHRTPAKGTLQPLGRIKQKGGKWVEAFALEGDFDPAALHSNSFECEWPPKSGRFQLYPEVDRAAWCTLEEARAKLLPAQVPFLDRLDALLAGNASG